MSMRILPSVITISVLALGWSHLSCSGRLEASRASSVDQSNSIDLDNKVPTVKFCDVLRKPFLYEAKTILIKARLSRYRDYITFYDENCVPTHPLISVEFDPSFQYVTVNEAVGNLDQIVRGSKNAWEGNVSVFVSAIGFFKEIPSNQRADYTELQYRFTVKKVSEIETTK